MKRFALLVAVIASVAHAQEDAPVAAERARLEHERAKVESEYKVEEKACYGKFTTSSVLSWMTISKLISSMRRR